MRQSPRLNSENKQLVDEILRQVTRIFPVTEYCLPFIGSILYLKKKGAELMGRYSDDTLFEQLSEYAKLLSNDPIKDAVVDVLRYVGMSVQGSKLEHIMNMVGVEEFDDSEYLYWYDYAIENATRYKNLIPQMVVPRGLTTLAQAFICGEAKKTFVPFGGLMNFATEIEGFDSLDAFELNHQTWLIGMLRLGLGDNADKCNFICSDIEKWSCERYDAIISMPPFGMKLNMKTQPMSFEAGRSEESELIAPSRFMESTTDSGICVAFAPNSLLIGSAAKKKFREWAIENKILDTVILLPGNMLVGTSIPLVCFILRKKPFHSNAVRMIDASGLYTNHQGRNRLSIGEVMSAFHTDTTNVSRTVSYEEIRNLDFSWNVKEYLQPECEYPEGYTALPLDEIVELPRLENSTIRDKGLVVKVSDLSADWAHPYIDLANLSEENNLRNYTRLDRMAILISTVRTLKPSIIMASEECPVWLNPNVLAIIPKDVIDPEFLCMTLAKMDIPTMGFGAPHISKTYLLRQKIAYPELSMQKILYLEASHEKALAKVQELGLQEVIDQMKADYMNEVRARKHDMMPHLRQLSSARKNLWYYLTHKDEFTEEEFMGGMKAEVLNQTDAIDALSNLLSIFSRESQFGTPEKINLDSYLLENYFDGDNYSVEFDTDYKAIANHGINIPEVFYNFDYSKGYKAFREARPDVCEGIDVMIARDDLKRLCDNIVFNAIHHGFTDPTRDDYYIDMQLTVNQERDMYQIDFVNNGTPLPQGMDKLRYGLRGEKAGVTAGTGEGGYVVKSITEHYGGDYDIFSETSDDFSLTTVRVLLPIYRDNEQ